MVPDLFQCVSVSLKNEWWDFALVLYYMILIKWASAQVPPTPLIGGGGTVERQRETDSKTDIWPFASQAARSCTLRPNGHGSAWTPPGAQGWGSGCVGYLTACWWLIIFWWGVINGNDISTYNKIWSKQSTWGVWCSTWSHIYIYIHIICTYIYIYICVCSGGMLDWINTCSAEGLVENVRDYMSQLTCIPGN